MYALNTIPRWLTNDHNFIDIDIDISEPETLEAGDLVYWEEPDSEDETYNIGILKTFGYASWKDECYGIMSAYVVSCDPENAYGNYIPLTHLEKSTIEEYLELREETYGIEDEETVSLLFNYIRERQSLYGWNDSKGDVSEPILSNDWYPSYVVQGGAS